MLSLNKLTKQRMQGADIIVIPKEVMEKNEATIKQVEVRQLLEGRHFPFGRCVLNFLDDNSETYFEMISTNEIALIRDMKTDNNVVFSAIIRIDTYTFGVTDTTLKIECPDIRVAAFKGHKRCQITAEQREEISQSLAYELMCSLCVFAYINRVSLAEPELQEKAVTKPTKKKRKNGTPVRYISTRKYTLTGQERKSRRGIPQDIYSRDLADSRTLAQIQKWKNRVDQAARE